ncbi:MAG: hypothetical protein R3Y59_10235 [bacterium]
MEKINLKNFAWYMLILSALVQVGLILCYDNSQISDAYRYLKLANDVVENGGIYPLEMHRNDSYIFGSGYVNFAALLLNLFGSVKVVLLANVLLLLGVALILYKIAQQYLSQKIASILLLLFTLYPTNYGITLYTLTEPLFMFLAFLSFYLFISGNTRNIILSGIAIALMNTVRPFIPVFIVLIPVAAFLLFKTERIKRISLCFLPMILTIAVIGSIHKATFGDFIYQSSTGGVNLMMGANDDADGSYNDEVFKEGNIGALPLPREDMSYAEKDKFWRKQSVEWIKQNPIKWVCLFPKKIFSLFIHDNHSMAGLAGDMKNREKYGPSQYVPGLITRFPRYKFFDLVIFYNQALYMAMMALFIHTSVIFIRKRNKLGITLIAWFILTTGLTIVTVGSPRYHYPLMPIVMLFAAYSLNRLICHEKS